MGDSLSALQLWPRCLGVISLNNVLHGTDNDGLCYVAFEKNTSIKLKNNLNNTVLGKRLAI